MRFFQNLPDDEAIALLLEQRCAHQATLEEYRKLEAHYFPKFSDGKPSSRGNLYAYFTLRRGIMLEQDSIRWCRWAITQLRARQRKSRGKSGEPEEA